MKQKNRIKNHEASCLSTGRMPHDSSLGTATVSGTLTVLGRTTLTDLGVTGNITAGVLSINGLEEEINRLGGPLRLQGQALQGIDMLNGKVTIDTEGTIKTEGSIAAKEYKAVAGESVGTGKILAGTKSVDIPTSLVKSNSRIFKTATSETNAALSVRTKVAGKKFVVSTTLPAVSDITFDWWLVNEASE